MKYKLPYEEQLNRVRRLRVGIEKDFSMATDENFEDAADAITSFFIQCYHLRDWLINSGFSRSLLDGFIKNSIWLSLCKDCANTQKHQKITKYKPQYSLVQGIFGVSTPIARHYSYRMKRNRFGIRVSEFVMSFDAVEVVGKCIQEWESFLAHSIRYEAPR